MNSFITRELRQIERDFSKVIISDEGLGIEIEVPVSQDTMSLVLDLREKLVSLGNEDMQLDMSGIKESMKDIKLEGKSSKNITKDINKSISNVIAETIDEMDFNNFSKMALLKEEKKKDLEIETFFKFENVDKNKILSAYCKAMNLEPTEENKNIGLLVLKNNTITIEKNDIEKEVNFFQYWLDEIIACIEGQFGLKIQSENEEENF